jgi:hypothetical protein
VLDSDAYGALSAELRHAEANHHNLDTLLPRLIAARSLDDADDIASVIHARVARATARPAGSGRTRKPPRLIAGLIPYADGPMADEMRQALDERRELIEQRADAVLTPRAHRQGAVDGQARHPAEGREAARGLVARRPQHRGYRDRYQITDDRNPLGPAAESTSQKIDAARARAALNRARSIAGDDPAKNQVRPSAATRSAPRL